MSPAAGQQCRDDPDELRILHWNIHSWRDMAGAPNTMAVAGLIRETVPHVVSLVEVDEPWGLPSVLAEVAATCGYFWIFGPSFEFGADASAGGFGNALLTAIPITAVQQWRLVSPPHPYDGTEPSEPRSVIIARLTFGSTSLWLGSTHLPRSDPEARTAAVHRLQQLTRRLSGPWLICGDFNAPPSSCFADHTAFQISPDPAQPTYRASNPAEPIDYCITAPDIYAESTVLRASGSDHLPLLTVTRQHRPAAAAAAAGPQEIATPAERG